MSDLTTYLQKLVGEIGVGSIGCDGDNEVRIRNDMISLVRSVIQPLLRCTYVYLARMV